VVRIVQGLAPTRVYSPRGRPGLQAGYCRAGCGWVFVRAGLKLRSAIVCSHFFFSLKTASVFHPPCSEAVTGRAGLQEWNSRTTNPWGSGEIPVPHVRSKAPCRPSCKGPPQREVGPEALCRPPGAGDADRGGMPAEAAGFRPIDVSSRASPGVRESPGGHEAAFSIRIRSRNANQLRSIRGRAQPFWRPSTVPKCRPCPAPSPSCTNGSRPVRWVGPNRVVRELDQLLHPPAVRSGGWGEPQPESWLAGERIQTSSCSACPGAAAM